MILLSFDQELGKILGAWLRFGAHYFKDQGNCVSNGAGRFRVG